MHRDCKASCGVCGGLCGLGPHVPAGLDYSGNFVKYHEVPYKFNQLILYSGHLFHSSFISREALLRMEAAHQVRLQRTSAQGLGIDLSSSGGWTRVKHVRRGGAVEAWNMLNPDQSVDAGAYYRHVTEQTDLSGRAGCA